MKNKENKGREKRPLLRKRLIKGFWAIVFAGMAAVALLFLLASWGVFGKLPTFKDLENPNLAVATEVISEDGVVLGKIYRKNRVNITYDQLPSHLVEALVATEDERFYKHSGIDMRSTLRAIAFLGKRGGGSTITQQLAKNLLEQGRGDHSIRGIIERILEKAKEYIVAIKLERSYTKQEILAMYLNQVDFVNNAIGIQSASKIYFNKPVQELTVEESAVFAGMLTNPSLYNPNSSRKELTRKRRNVVFGQMRKNNFITREQQDSLSQIPLELDFTFDDHNTGLAPYLRAVIQNDFLVDWVKNNPKVDGERYDIYRDGLKIYTTINSDMQKTAEKAVQDHLTELQEDFSKEKSRYDVWKNSKVKTALALAISNSDRYNSLKRANSGWSREKVIEEMQKPVETRIYHPVKGEVDTLISPMDSIKHHRLMLQSAFLVTDPKNGHVKAWVGGRNFKYFKFDHVTTPRQVGSTFKPFLYAVAVDNGWSPCFTINNLPVSIRTETGKMWTPKNSGGSSYDGRPVRLKDGLAQSMNNISAELIRNIGPRPVISLAERAGLEDVPQVYSIALGTTEQTVFDLTEAYTAFANGGVATEPMFISRIEDKNGNVLAEFSPGRVVEAMSPQTAWIMLQMMRGVVTHGTASRISWKYGLDNFIAGKTGTTDDNTDGWFVGLTPDLMGVVWTGADDPALRFNSTAKGQGANAALPIWANFFKEIYQNEEKFGIARNANFNRPPNITTSLNCDDPMAGFGGGGSTTLEKDHTGTVIPDNQSQTSGGVVDPDDEEDDFE